MSIVVKVLNKIRRIKYSVRNDRHFKTLFNRFVALSQQQDQRFPINWNETRNIANEKTEYTDFDNHYIYHPAWAARILAKTKPDVHFDISSSLYFCSIISAFIPIKFYDYRPAKIHLSNLTSERADLLSLPFENNSVKSISCMHTIEHIGLDRYGDPLDPDGDLKAINELKRVLAPSGNLLFVVPIGKPKLVFNAHRIYSYDQIISYFNDLELKEFTLIPDKAENSGLIYNATEELADAQDYGCGCFWFTKPSQLSP